MKRNIFFAALAFASLAGQLFAGDLKITFKKETKSVGTTQNSEEVRYYTSRFQRTNNDKDRTDSLTDYRDFTMYTIDHKKKTISKITLDDATKIIKLSSAEMQNEMQKADPETKKMMESIFGDSGLFGGSGPAKAEKAGTEKVAGRTCNKWKITIGKSVFNISADPALEMPLPKGDAEKASKLKEALSMSMPGMGDTLVKLEQEMSKIKGVPLKTDMQMSMGPVTIRTLEEATKIEEGPIPASVFDLPKGYKTEDIGKKTLEQLQKSAKKK